MIEMKPTETTTTTASSNTPPRVATPLMSPGCAHSNGEGGEVADHLSTATRSGPLRSEHDGVETTTGSEGLHGGPDVVEGDDAASSPPKRCCALTKYGLGVVLILLVAIIWVGASEWIQYIFGSLDFDKPYFLTYFNTCGFMLWNLGYIVSPTWRRQLLNPSVGDDDDNDDEAETANASGGAGSVDAARADTGSSGVVGAAQVSTRQLSSRAKSAESEERVPLAGAAATSDHAGILQPEYLETTTTAPLPGSHPKHYSLRKIVKAAACFCPLWFMANVLFNYSLSRTSVSSNTILSTTSSVWTLLLSRLVLKVPVTLWKTAAVALSIGGTVMVALGDTNSGSDSRSGDALALFSAFFYAAYTTVLKWWLPCEAKYSMGMVFGAVGVLNALLMWPGFFVVHFTGVEPFEWPPLGVLWPLELNALVGTNLSDVLWAKSVILTSPVVATLGLSLTTPIAMISDAILKHRHFGVLYVFGALTVTAGFTISNI